MRDSPNRARRWHNVFVPSLPLPGFACEEHILVGALLLALLPVGVSAQTADGEAEPRFIFGPLGHDAASRRQRHRRRFEPRELSRLPPIRTSPLTLAPGGRLLRSASAVAGSPARRPSSTSTSTSRDQLRSFNFNQEPRAELTAESARALCHRQLSQDPAAAQSRDRRACPAEHVLAASAGFALKLGARTNLEFEGATLGWSTETATTASADDCAAASNRDTDPSA